jgi:hypothetical protein
VPGVAVGVLDRLDRLIDRYALHKRGGSEPVSLVPLMEAFSAGYRSLPDEVEAVVVRWRYEGQKFVRVAYHHELREHTETARKRHAEAHEYAHIVCRHRGDMFVMWKAGEDEEEVDPFERHISRCQEGECDLVAAYLLVPLVAIWEHQGMEAGYIARVLDVPANLVELRYAIWRRHGR